MKKSIEKIILLFVITTGGLAACVPKESNNDSTGCAQEEYSTERCNNDYSFETKLSFHFETQIPDYLVIVGRSRFAYLSFCAEVNPEDLTPYAFETARSLTVPLPSEVSVTLNNPKLITLRVYNHLSDLNINIYKTEQRCSEVFAKEATDQLPSLGRYTIGQFDYFLNSNFIYVAKESFTVANALKETHPD